MNKKYYVSESAFINVSCALAKRMMEERLGDKYPLMFEDNGNCYNEEGQEHFNQLYEKVQNILEDADIIPTDIKLDEELGIDINQYVQRDEEDSKVIYFRESAFLEDAKEYLQEDKPDFKIIIE
jgi:DNA-binding NtrC family response regulator